MIKIAVCDDEPLELGTIGSILTDYLQKHPEMDLEFTLFQSSEQLISFIPNEFFHIYLLDIVMDGKNGIEAGDLIHRRYPQALLIYLTSSPDYAITSYTVNAYYYLLKPLEEEKLIPVLERAVADCKEQDNYQLIRTNFMRSCVVTIFVPAFFLTYRVATDHAKQAVFNYAAQFVEWIIMMAGGRNIPPAETV